MNDKNPEAPEGGGGGAAYSVSLRSFADVLDLGRVLSNSKEASFPELHANGEAPAAAIGLVLLYASWNTAASRMLVRQEDFRNRVLHTLLQRADELTTGLENCDVVVSVVQVDTEDGSVRLCIGDDAVQSMAPQVKVPLPPSELPCLALVVHEQSMPYADLRYIRDVSSHQITSALFSLPVDDTTARSNSMMLPWKPMKNLMDQIEAEYQLSVSAESCRQALRIFVAGDRSSVGKSSVCLGLLGTMLRSGAYEPSDLAYIKPATQSESAQLIQRWCESRNVACVPVGPLVYYRGFTRAYLAGETPRSPDLLRSCACAVDRLARGKKVVVVDGVGFPAVGSICGTDNPRVAVACSYPTSDDGDDNDNANAQSNPVGRSRSPMGVVLVGGPGVGAAVDGFNLNATYFEKYGVPVLGAIFNKLELSGFYSLESCRKEITSYFDQRESEGGGTAKAPFGFVPLFRSIAGEDAFDHVDEYILLFEQHVDVKAIIDAAQRVKDSVRRSVAVNEEAKGPTSPKRAKIEYTGGKPSLSLRSRLEIEQEAINSGAAPSA
jgi:AAA domain